MPGRTPEDALRNFTRQLRATTACITDRPILASDYRPSPQPHQLGFVPRNEPVPLRSEDRGRYVLLSVVHNYEIQPSEARRSYRLQTTAYIYEILDPDGEEIVSYHWHPGGDSRVIDPHLHVSYRLNPIEVGRDQDPLRLADLNLLTGFVTLTDVVRLLIEEFGIRPRVAGWDSILRVNREAALAEQAG